MDNTAEVFSELAGPSKWLWMEREVELFAVACEMAKRDLTTPDRARFRDGEAWDEYVCKLTDWAEKKRLPLTRFVEQVQAELAPQFRKHVHSHIALEQAIKRARAARKARRAPRARVK